MPFLAISLVSAGAIAYEILLMRLYAAGQWHHFAYMIISIALLGYGASGTFLALARARLMVHYELAWGVFAALFGLSAAYGFSVARNIIINPFELAWDPGQAIELLWTYLVLMVPFFCAASCIGLSFMRHGGGEANAPVARVYRYDLTGAGAGAAAITALLFLLPAGDAMRWLIVVGFGAATLVVLRDSHGAFRWWAIAIVACGAMVAWREPAETFMAKLSPYKDLSYAQHVPGAEVIHEQSSPLGRLAVVRSPEVPFRHAPGLSLVGPVPPAAQLGLFIDGNFTAAITRFDGDLEKVAYLDFTTRALPYHLLVQPSVLLLSTAAADEVLLARRHDARTVEIAEPDVGVTSLLRARFADYAGHVYDIPRTRFHIADARGALALADHRFDLIRLPLTGATAGGFGSLQETYGATVEAFVGYLEHLNDGGFLAIDAPFEPPPRMALKLLATAIEALHRVAAANPRQSLLMIRGIKSVVLLVKRGTLTTKEVEAAGQFAETRGFDMTYAPGLARNQANRFNILDEPDLYDGATALLGSRHQRFLADYKFDLRPARDDRPFLHDFLKWNALPELLALSRQGTMPLIEWGHIILVLTLVQACAVSIVLILLPLVVWRRNAAIVRGGAGRVAIYFVALGLAFLFVEMAFIQRLTLFLGHPIYAVAVVLAAFLVFAGLGAGMSPRLAAYMPDTGRLTAVDVSIGVISVIAVVYLIALGPVTHWLITLPVSVKVPLVLLAIAPLAFFMGMPFPLGLAQVGHELPHLVPWAWGINGCASVVSAVLATLLAIEFGFSAVVLLAVILYAVAALTWRRGL